MIKINIEERINIEGLPYSSKNRLKREFTHSNPEYHKKQKMGYSTWDTPSVIKTFVTEKDKSISFPNGGLNRILNILKEEEKQFEVQDNRTLSEYIEFPEFKPLGRDDTALYDYQEEAVLSCMEYTQGCVRAPTGSGKTCIGLALASRLGQRTLVLVRNAKIQDQWYKSAREELGLDDKDISVLRSGKKHKANPKLTIALQQSMYAKKSKKLDEILKEDYGLLIVDEVHEAAANTFLKVVNKIPCKFRIGLSADERRKDNREFLIYDLFGHPIYEISRKKLENENVIRSVMLRVVESSFEADWYLNAEGAERNWNDLLDAMEADIDRHELVLDTIRTLLRKNETPIFVFTHRRHYVETIVQDIEERFNIPVGVLLGGVDSAQRFDEDKKKLESGDIKIAVGTYKAIGTGINIPAVTSGFCVTPIGNNRQFFGQVRGRMCRKNKGKSNANIYYLLDTEIFPRQIDNLANWNDRNIQIFRSGNWIKRL